MLFIAFALAMDAFAVAVSSGVTVKNLKVNHALTIALCFGLFQAFMPVIGWLAGIGLKEFIAGVDHWIAFGLLSFVGCRMIYESVKLKEDRETVNPLQVHVLLLLSIATSIDALAVGLSLSLLHVSIIMPVMVIGIVTFLLSFFGVFLGNRGGHFFENKIEIAGGFIMIGIGVKILVEHLGAQAL